MKISVVRFNDSSMCVGTELNPCSSLKHGEKTISGTVSLSKYDDLFLQVTFTNPSKSPYSQLIPWAQVSTVFFENSK